MLPLSEVHCGCKSYGELKQDCTKDIRNRRHPSQTLKVQFDAPRLGGERPPQENKVVPLMTDNLTRRLDGLGSSSGISEVLSVDGSALAVSAVRDTACSAGDGACINDKVAWRRGTAGSSTGSSGSSPAVPWRGMCCTLGDKRKEVEPNRPNPGTSLTE